MLKAVTFFCVLLISFCANAQSIEHSKNSLAAIIKADGTLQGTTGVAVGYILGDGKIENADHVFVGNITSDGIIQNSIYQNVGYVIKGGTVQDAGHNVIGSVSDEGIILNAKGIVIGKAPGVKKTWAAVCFFFYKVN